MLLAISNEPKGVLDAWAKKKGVKYPILSSNDAVRTYDIKAIPHKYVIDAKGKVVEEGNIHVNGSMLEEYLKDAEVLPAGDYSKKFDPIKKAISAGNFGTAWDLCGKLEKDKTEGENAQKVKSWIEERGTKTLESADKAKEAGQLMDAIDGYQDVEKRWKGEPQKTAKAKLDELKKDKDSKKALDAKKFWDMAKDAEAKKDKATAAALYMKVAKACKGTKVGEDAEAKAKSLQ